MSVFRQLDLTYWDDAEVLGHDCFGLTCGLRQLQSHCTEELVELGDLVIFSVEVPLLTFPFTFTIGLTFLSRSVGALSWHMAWLPVVEAKSFFISLLISMADIRLSKFALAFCLSFEQIYGPLEGFLISVLNLRLFVCISECCNRRRVSARRISNESVDVCLHIGAELFRIIFVIYVD